MNDWMFSTIKTKDLDNEIDKILSRSLVDAVYIIFSDLINIFKKKVVLR